MKRCAKKEEERSKGKGIRMQRVQVEVKGDTAHRADWMTSYYTRWSICGGECVTCVSGRVQVLYFVASESQFVLMANCLSKWTKSPLTRSHTGSFSPLPQASALCSCPRCMHAHTHTRKCSYSTATTACKHTFSNTIRTIYTCLIAFYYLLCLFKLMI